MASAFVESVAERAQAEQPKLPGAGLDWLAQVRRGQLEAFLREGLPGPRVEAWKYTSLRAFERHAFPSTDSEAGRRDVDPGWLELPGADGARMVFVHGVFRADLSRLDGLPKGMHLQPLSQALAGKADALRPAFERDWHGPTDAFARLNTALAAEGMVLSVDEGVHIEQPLHLVHVGLDTGQAFAWHARNMIRLGRNASLSLIEHHAGQGSDRHMATQVSDIELEQGASLEWMLLQQAGEGAQLVRRDTLTLGAEASAEAHVLELGASLARHQIDAALAGDGARLVTRGVFMPRGRQHHDTRLDIRHQARDTRSDALWRGVADGRGRGVFHGALTVAEGADGADAALNNKNLLLSPHAEIDTQPVLEIYADEVMAAHGATVGQLDQAALFYLRSRGLPQAQARRLLTAAFCQAALADIPIKALREHVQARLAERLPGEDRGGSVS